MASVPRSSTAVPPIVPATVPTTTPRNQNWP
jgi:hypothetical protein